MHGNNKSADEIRMAAEAGVGHLILDSFDEIERCGHDALPRGGIAAVW
jgi:diaminopimelate decarboxylase